MTVEQTIIYSEPGKDANYFPDPWLLCERIVRYFLKYANWSTAKGLIVATEIIYIEPKLSDFHFAPICRFCAVSL